jgi:hypothetical protein
MTTLNINNDINIKINNKVEVLLGLKERGLFRELKLNVFKNNNRENIDKIARESYKKVIINHGLNTNV